MLYCQLLQKNTNNSTEHREQLPDSVHIQPSPAFSTPLSCWKIIRHIEEKLVVKIRAQIVKNVW